MKRFFSLCARAVSAVHHALEWCWLAPVRLYRKVFSGLKSAPTCRFRPTCSEYALLAVREWGILIGTGLTLIRLVRCNPFSRGGDDPVPTRAEAAAAIRNLIRRNPRG